jgi:ATP-dependent Clp protease protease subunit
LSEHQGSPERTALQAIFGGAAEPQHRTLYLQGEITGATSIALDRALRTLWDEPGEVFLIINSPGGECTDGFALHDALRNSTRAGSPVTGYVQGIAMSAAVVVLQGCENRRSSPHSRFMIHEAWEEWGTGGRPGEVERDAEFLRAISDQYLDMVARRSKMTFRQLKQKVADGSWYFDARAARKHGFLDWVAPK